MSGSINNIKKIAPKMRQMFIQTSQPTIGQDMKQHSKPSLTSKIAIVQSMGLRGKKKKYKGKHIFNPSQTTKKPIVQSMELRGNKKKYKSKKNANLGREMHRIQLKTVGKKNMLY